MEQHKNSLIVFGGITRNIDDDYQDDSDQEALPEIFICNLTKYLWSKLALDSELQFLHFSAVARPSENELLLFGGQHSSGKV
jgi:hypothetical protein